MRSKIMELVNIVNWLSNSFVYKIHLSLVGLHNLLIDVRLFSLQPFHVNKFIE